MKKIIFLFSIIALSLACFGQNTNYSKDNTFTIGFYNVENLYDTINDPNNPFDEEFTPEGKSNWNTEKYNKKIKDLAKVISSLNKNELPEIVGFAELENAVGLNDLVRSELIKSGNYKIVHFDCKDTRGIDVGLIYRADEFKVLKTNTYQIRLASDTAFRTRDILHVEGQTTDKEVLHVFVNHWSSRRAGEKESQDKRFACATTLKSKVDSVLKKNKAAKIVIIGDFNDEPTNESIYNVLGAKNNLRNTKPDELFNLMYDKCVNGLGTLSFDSKWNMLDNIIVSGELLRSKSGWQVSSDGGQIFKDRWMLYDNAKAGELLPNRTYGGNKYFGGISDHFPVFVMLKKN